MRVVTHGPLQAGGFSWQSRFGGHCFTVIVKATFELCPGRARLAASQDPLNHQDRYWSDDAPSSIYAPSDMAPYKDRADVTLVGNVFSPNDSGSQLVVARLQVGAIDKRVAAHSERWLGANGALCKGAPFHYTPLRYEHAAGGADTDNPVGRPSAGSVDCPSLPTLLSAGSSWGPHCFAPIAEAWPARRRLWGDAPNNGGTGEWRRRALHADLDRRYFNAAPDDQRLETLREDERLIISHMHPSHTHLECSLPGLRPRALSQRDGSEVRLTADSLWIDMTRTVCTMTWRGVIENRQQDLGDWILVELDERDSDSDSFPPDRVSGVELVGSAAPHRERLPTLDLAASGEFFESQPNTQAPACLPFATVLPFSSPSKPNTFARALPAPPSVVPASVAPVSLAPPPVSPPSVAPRTTRPPMSPWAGASLGNAPHASEPPISQNATDLTPPPLLFSLGGGDTGVDELAACRPLDESRILELLGHEPEAIETIREKWQAELDELDELDNFDEMEETPADPFEASLRAAFDGTPLREESPAEDDLSRIMGLCAAKSPAQLPGVLAADTREGAYGQRLVLAHGELRLLFDERETLRATVASVCQSGDEALLSALADAREFLDDPLRQDAVEVAEWLRDRICSACDGKERETLDRRVARILRDGRHYRERRVLDASWACAQLRLGNSTVPLYVPKKLAERTPLFNELTVRVVGHLHPRQDQNEESPVALRAVALGRVIERTEH